MSVSPEVDSPMNPLHPSVADKLSTQYTSFYNKHLINVQQAQYQSVSLSRIERSDLRAYSDGLPVGHIQDVEVHRRETAGPDHAIKIRCFTPIGEPPANGWPVMVYYHGGGWVLGNINTENNICKIMCARANCVVITPDYRLAPEDVFPAAIDDCWETLLWLFMSGTRALNVDIHKVAVGGASAGANLAAVMTQKSLGRSDHCLRIDIKAQLLVVPITDNTATIENNPTWKSLEHTAALPAAKMLWYRRHYLPDECTWRWPEASPLLFTGDFGRLPRAVILVAEFDLLRHEGEEYARKLQEAGVNTRIEVMKGVPHSFIAMDAVLDEGRRGINILCESLIEVFR